MIDRFKKWFFSKGITSRTIIAATLIITITILLATSSLVAVFRDRFSEQAKVNAIKDSRLVADKMDMFLDLVENDAVYLVTGAWCQQIFTTHPSFGEAEANTKYVLYRALQDVTYQRLLQKVNYLGVILYDIHSNPLVFSDQKHEEELLYAQQGKIRDFLASKAVDSLVYLHPSPWEHQHDRGTADCISYLRKVFDKESGKLMGAVEFEIDCRQLEKLYQAVLENSSQVAVLSSEGELQLSSVPTEQAEDWQLTSLMENGADDGVVEINGNLVAVNKLANGDMYVFNCVPRKVYLGGYTRYVLMAIAVSIIAWLLSIYLAKFFIQSIAKPLNKIIKGVMSIDENNMDSRLTVLDGGEIGQLAAQINRMLDRTQRLLNSIVESQRKKRETELALIQMKMTPHFFYNVLESICGLIVTDEKPQAIRVINLLAEFYRGILSRGQEIITLRQELKISDSYIRIMQVCYPNKCTYQVLCPEELMDCSICKLTLQPILENAIHHGLSSIEEGGLLTVKVQRCNDDLQIDIIDNGCGIDPALGYHLPDNRGRVHTEGYGLRNTDERVKMYFGQEYGLSFEPCDAGTVVRIRLPMT